MNRIWTALALAVVLAAGTPSRAEAVRLTVTGETMSVNGYTQVPKGLFGVHWTDLDPQRIEDWGIECARQMHGAPRGGPTIPREGLKSEWQGLSVVLDCLGDRYHPALAVTRPDDYEQYFTEYGERFARQCAEADWPGWAEFWNEPFLNWSYKPGVNYDPKFYDPSNQAEGAAMTLKGQDQPTEHLVWSRAVRTVHADSGMTDLQAYLAYNYIGRHHPAGHEFEFRGRRYRNQEMWWGKDPTQVSYWSGKQNQLWYERMLVPFAKAVKETNPDVQVIAGWGFDILGGNNERWEMLYKPTIDAAWKWIDGVYEHHYHWDPRRVAARYELVTAYGMTKYGKWLQCYNTETGGRVDTQLPGHEAATGRDDPLAMAMGALTYGLRDIVHMIAYCPDKAVTRTTHGADKEGWGLGGDEFVFRLLKPLRGRLIRAESPDTSIWPVASLNERGELVVVVFNDHRNARDLEMKINAPRDTALEDGVRTWVRVADSGEELTLQHERLKASGATVTIQQSIPGRTTMRWVFPVAGDASTEPVVQRKQYFHQNVLVTVNPDEISSLPVDLPADALEGASAACIRISAERPGDDGAKVRLNGGEWKMLPKRTGIVEVPVDPAELKDSNDLEFRAGAEKAHGLKLLAVSLVVDTRKE